MQQIFYTSCRAGQSWDGSEGFQIRAASSGVAPGRLDSAIGYMAYRIAASLSPLQPLESLPVRLAYLKTSELGPILCHSVSAGLDPSTHRPGNFFSHLVLNLPSDFTAEAAIRTWDSACWQRTDGDYEAALPDIQAIHAGQLLTDDRLRQFLSCPRAERMFRFVLAAILAAEADDRIFVAAASQEVAFCIYGLTRVLPGACLRDFTFSTYEFRPLNCPARLVGTWAGDTAETDLPSSCYTGSAFGYNHSTGRASQVPLPGDFVELAIAALLSGDRRRLDQLLTVCCHYEIEQLGLLDLVCRAESAGSLAGGDLQRLASSSPQYLAHLWSESIIGPAVFDDCWNTCSAPELWITELVGRRNALGSELTQAIVNAAARNPNIDPFSLASQMGASLLDLLGDGQDLDTLLGRMLDGPVERILSDDQVLEFLQAVVRGLAGPGQVPAAIREKLESILVIRSFLTRPVLENAVLERVSSALRTLPSPAVEQSIEEAALKRILAETDSPSMYSLVETVLKNLGPIVPEGIGGFYHRLVEHLGNCGDICARRHLLCAVIATGLAASQEAGTWQQIGAMTEQARDLAEQVAKGSRRHVFAFVEQQSHDWPDEARLRWNLFARFLRPAGLFRRIWHVNCF